MPNVIASVKALIKKGDRYLIVKESLHNGDITDLPGGKIEYGEAPEAALQRELMEELRIAVHVKGPAGVWYFFSANNKHQVVCFTYLCHLLDEDASLKPVDGELGEVFWLTPGEILASSEFALTDSFREFMTKIQHEDVE